MQPSEPDQDTGLAVPRARRPSAEEPDVRRLPAALLHVLEPLASRVAERITVRVRAEIGPFGGPHRPRLHRLIGDAVELAVRVYLRAAAGDRSGYGDVGEHFRSLGRAGAASGVSMEPAVDAIGIARDVVWEAVSAVVAQEDVEGHVVANLGSGVASYLNHLGAQMKAGFADEARRPVDPRLALLVGLLQRRPVEEMAIRAAEVGRRLEDPVVVVTAQRHGALQVGVVLPQGSLSRAYGDRTIVVCDPAEATSVRDALRRIGPDVVVAVSWPIALSQVWHGYQWTRRVLELARARRLPGAGHVIECSAHRTQLWREADSTLLDVIAQDLLAPLEQFALHWRLKLAETLERYLEFNESAPALGKALGGLHQNTVRYRLHVLDDLYGERLEDPDTRMELRACLRMVLPAWRTEVEMRRRRKAGQKRK